MKPKMILKICVDVAMTIALLLLMAYELVGHEAHEWLGIGMFVLFVTHHILNRKWSGNLLKGHYTPLRIWQTLLVVCVLLCMIGSMVSGVILSPPCSFLSSNQRRSFFCQRFTYGFCLLGACVYVASSGAALEHDDGNGEESVPEGIYCPHMRTADLAVVIAVYGAYAFVKRDIAIICF